MGYTPPIPLETKRAADGNRMDVVRKNGAFAARLTVMTTGEPLVVHLTQSEAAALLTGPEQAAFVSIFQKLINGACVKAGWIDDLTPEPT